MMLFKILLSLPKTILFNFRVFSFETALKLPVLIAYNVKVNNIHKNCIEIDSYVSRFMIKLNIDNGSDGVNTTFKQKGYFDIRKKGKLIFNGKANFSSGISIRIDNGIVTIGNKFSCNKNCFIACSEGITLGENVLLGWNVNIRDSDGHSIIILDSEDNKKFKSEDHKVSIGNHVWVASNVDILKGVKIPTNCVIGYNSCVTKKFTQENCILAGYPAKVVKENIDWKI